MYWLDDENGTSQPSNCEYMETVLQEALTVTSEAINEASLSRGSFLFEEYVRYLDTLTGNLARISEVLLAIRVNKQLRVGDMVFHAARQEAAPAQKCDNTLRRPGRSL